MINRVKPYLSLQPIYKWFINFLQDYLSTLDLILISSPQADHQGQVHNCLAQIKKQFLQK